MGSSEDDATAALLAHAESLYALHSAEDILAYVCREARELTKTTRVFGSYVAPSTTWQTGLHIATDVTPPPPPAMISAAFAIHRRLSKEPELLRLAPSEETAAIFRGFGSDGSERASLVALPLLTRRRRLVGQIVLYCDAAEIIDAEALRAAGHLARLASVALEHSNRLAFARRDQDRLQILSEATEEALWDWNLETGSFWWGGGIHRVIRSGGEIIGTTASWKHERLHPADRERVTASFDWALASPDSSWSAEYRFRRGDGTWAVVEDRGYFLRDTEGRAYRIIGALRDVSEKKWAETQQQFLVHASAALAESLEVEKHLSTVARLAAGSVADWCALVLFPAESDGKNVVAIGGHGDRALPASPETLEDNELRAAIGARSMVRVPILAGERTLGSVTLATTEASMRMYRSGDVAFAEEFARRCAVAIEKARLYEQAQNAIRARDAFMAILGHELRNPLSPITTALHLMKLRDRKSTREQEVIERQVKHLTRLVDDLLDVSRVERGKVELTKKPLQLSEVIAKAVEIASPLLEQRRHQLDLDVAPTGMMLLADETRIAQVVANLLTNAARYTDPGGRITVSAKREGQHAVLRVRDNGIGMAPDLLPRVFELFVQGPRTPDRRQGGLGLGLSLVRSLVTLHGGTVAAHSEGPGKGSEFVVRLPALPVELLGNDVERSAPAGGRSTEARRILLVDDNADAAELLAEVLRSCGHEVVVANDGPQGLIAAARIEPEIAILDIGLPVMDGYELARRLVATLGRRPFMIALTGYGQENDRARAREAGFDEHIVKPVDADWLLKTIEGLQSRQTIAGGDRQA